MKRSAFFIQPPHTLSPRASRPHIYIHQSRKTKGDFTKLRSNEMLSHLNIVNNTLATKVGSRVQRGIISSINAAHLQQPCKRIARACEGLRRSVLFNLRRKILLMVRGIFASEQICWMHECLSHKTRMLEIVWMLSLTSIMTKSFHAP